MSISFVTLNQRKKNSHNYNDLNFGEFLFQRISVPLFEYVKSIQGIFGKKNRQEGTYSFQTKEPSTKDVI